MFRRAQDRIRMYYYKTKEELLKTNEIAIPQKQLQALILELHAKLKLNQFHGYYFDRARNGDENMKSICDIWGTFTCQGRWDKEKCLYHHAHSINPYVSREARIIFQTWNLDHNKERSRSIIPAIRSALYACASSSIGPNRNEDGRDRNVENGKVCRPLNVGKVESCGRNVVINGRKIVLMGNVVDVENVRNDENVADFVASNKKIAGVEKVVESENVVKGDAKNVVIPVDDLRLDVEGIYADLFTTANLKLVHIVCHDKGAHVARKAGPYLM